MEEKTKAKLWEMLEAVEGIDGVEVTGSEVNEYIRGDPTANDSKATGAEIELTGYITHDAETDDDENPYRVK